jgi:hypothetical protein
MALAEANQLFVWSSIRMPLAKANQQSQLGHPSWMPLIEANQQSQFGHPSRILLTEVNHHLSRSST